MVYQPGNEWSYPAFITWILGNMPNPIAMIASTKQEAEHWLDNVVRAYTHQHTMRILNFPAVPK